MSMDRLMSMPCVVEKVTVTVGGGYNTDITSTAQTRSRCYAEPAGSVETLDDRDTGARRLRVFMPPCAPVDRHSVIVIDGRRFAVDGEPSRWARPGGCVHHLEFDAVEVVG